MTIYDIAKLAGVSPSTVSRVLNNKSNISLRTRNKVLAVIDEHGYLPDAFTRGMTKKTRDCIGVLVTDIRHIHYANMAHAIEQTCYELGLSVILCNTGDSIEHKAQYLSMLAQNRVSGIILVGSIFNDKMVETSLLEIVKDIPVLFTNGLIHGEQVYSVLVDSGHGIELCAEHLRKQGYEKLALLTTQTSYSAKRKIDGYCNSQLHHGFATQIEYTDGTFKDTYEKASKLLNSINRPDAIICSEDTIAITCIRAVHDLKLRCPEDIGITGYNNTLLTDYAFPPITSVDNKPVQVGRMSVQILNDLIKGNSVSSKIMITPDIVVRKSSQRKGQ